jgi:acyl-CoA synthetase (AMP-forming)/AMP-acid ligase II
MPAMEKRWQGPLPSPAFGHLHPLRPLIGRRASTGRPIGSPGTVLHPGGETLTVAEVPPAPEIPDIDLTTFTLARAEELGGKPALIDGPSGRAISFAECNRQVEALAGALAARGIGKGDVVAIYMPNLPEYAVLFQGVLRANATNTTANPLYTEHELGHQLSDSGAKLMFTIAPFLDTARAAARHAGCDEIVVVGETEGDEATLADLLAEGRPAPELDIDPAVDLAVLPYSSGTTGLPKGVMLTHRNLIANVLQLEDAFAIEADDVMIGVLPFFHIYGQTVIMNLGLRNGTTIVTMPRFDLDQFLGLIAEHRVTLGWVVPPIALALAKHPAVDDADLSSLRLIMSGAAPLGAELSAAVGDRLDVPTIQGYGMTETSPVTHVSPIEPELIKGGSIGLPVPGTESRLVDPESGRDGTRGELWIRGPQVMAGYLNNEEATAHTIDSEGWLHTGDIAEIDDDGYYAIVDRLKELIKYKGFQVPPAELEAILITHPAIADCAVIGVPDDECGELPKAFLVVSGEASDDEIKEYVAEKVSPQKKVRLIERIDEIPKSASGKILRRELAKR